MGSRRNKSFAVDTRLLLVEGVAAARAGEHGAARRYLERLLRAEPEPDELTEACLWLSRISTDEREKRNYLQEVLARRPGEPRARRELAILDGRLQPEEIVDPETLKAQAPTEQTPAVHRFTCPHCAARLVFTPDGESLYCEHCGYGQTPEQTGEVEEQDFIVAMARAEGHRQPVGTQTFQCDSCSASFFLAPTALSFTCPYCDATYSLSEGTTQSLIPPDLTIPFVVTEEAAQKRVDDWLRDKGIGRRALVYALYLPLWTFDVGGAIRWSGYRQVQRNPGHIDLEGPAFVPEREEGDYAILLDDYPVAASKALPAALHPLLQQFDFNAAVPFEASYLANWPAQTYEITVGDASLAARRAAFKQHEEKVRRSLARLQQLRLSPAHIDILSYRLLLVPLWLAHFEHEGRRYTAVVNGQTGAVLGEEPPRGLRGTLSRLFD